MKKSKAKPRRGIRFWLAATAIVLAVCLAGSAVAVHRVYSSNLKPRSSSESLKLVNIPLGSTVQEIADDLEKQGIIRKSWAFQWYVRTANVRDKLQAGSYALRPNQSVQDIVDILTKGRVAVDQFTILPAQRIDEVEQAFINAGFKPAAVEAALKASQYKDHPALSDKPAGASLEGYLYPETFQKTANTTPEQIVEASLDQMQRRLTPKLRQDFVKRGLTVHEGVILASVIENEVSRADDRQKASQVFLKRLDGNMALQSDVTVHYGRLQEKDGDAYDTYSNKGLPKGPISNVSESSLEAVAHPADTDYLFFVAGDDGITYFSKTPDEHQRLIREHCSKERCPAQ